MKSALAHSVPFTDMSWALMLVLVGIGLPRTALVDLDILTPEGSLLYYALALVPFAAWLGVAMLRPTRRPVMDFLVLGVFYGVSLILVHQLFWNASGAGHSVPQSAIEFTERFGPSLHDPILRLYTSGIALVIGIGTGLIGAAVAALAGSVRRSFSGTASPR